VSTPKSRMLDCVRLLQKHVQDLMESGEDSLLCCGAAAAALEEAKPKPLSAPVRPLVPKPVQPVPVKAAAAPGSPLEALAQELTGCRLCPLGQSRKKLVFGEGDPEAGLVFVGEAPGAEGDREGLPFVGQAGKLLTKIIESMGLTREGLYLCNVLKCRPPGSRNPEAEEIAACKPNLEKQLCLLRPRIICALGSFAAQTLLDTQEPINQLRGKVFAYRGIPVVPTLHPAALLYHPQNKRVVWEDMKLIAGKLNLKPV